MMSSGKALKAAFSDCFFDPRKPGPLATICEANSVDYLLERAAEILRDTRRFQNASEVRARLRDAAAILGYAMTLIPAETTFHKPCATCKRKWLEHGGITLDCPDVLNSRYVDPDRGAT